MARKPVLLALVFLLTPLAASARQQQSGPTTQEQTKPTDKNESAKPERKTHVRLGTVTVGAFYSHYSLPLYYGYPCGYWPGALFWEPFWGDCLYPFRPAYFVSFAPAPDKGEVKLRVNQKDADVYLDGAYAGKAEHLKSMWLEPGAYDLEVTGKSRAGFHRRIYVLTGKTLKIDAALVPQKTEVQP